MNKDSSSSYYYYYTVDNIVPVLCYAIITIASIVHWLMSISFL